MDDVAAFMEAQNVRLPSLNVVETRMQNSCPQIKFKGIDFDYGEGPWGSVKLRTAMADLLNA